MTEGAASAASAITGGGALRIPDRALGQALSARCGPEPSMFLDGHLPPYLLHPSQIDLRGGESGSCRFDFRDHHSPRIHDQ
jgi:hypothetical protein